MKHLPLFKKIESLPLHMIAEIDSYVDYLLYKHHPPQPVINDVTDMEELFFSLAGSWKSEETGDELNETIYNSRNDSQREILL